MGVPQRGSVLQDWVYNALVALCLNCDGTPSQFLISKHAGPVHFGFDGMDTESPVEVFCQRHHKVLGLLDLPKNLAMEGVVSDSLLSLSGDCQDVALVDVECHLPLFLPVFELIQLFLEYAEVSLGSDFVV